MCSVEELRPSLGQDQSEANPVQHVESCEAGTRGQRRMGRRHPEQSPGETWGPLPPYLAGQEHILLDRVTAGQENVALTTAYLTPAAVTSNLGNTNVFSKHN